MSTAEPKKGVAHAADAVKSGAAPTADDATCIVFERFQCFMAAAKEMDLQLVQVTDPVNNGLNLLSGGTRTRHQTHHQTIHARLVQTVFRQLCYLSFFVCAIIARQCTPG